MSTIDIIKQRHSVRRFKDIPLDLKTVEQLNQEIEVCNKESGLHIQLITNEPEAFQGEKPSYGQFKGCKNYLMIIGPKGMDIEAGYRSVELMKKYDVAIWAHHGMFASGEDFDLTFGLMHTVEKSAEILVKTLSMSPTKLQTITPQNFRDLAKDFHVSLPEQFLYEKGE